MFQDAVETMAWTVAKEVDAPTKDNHPFTQLWDAVRSGKKNSESKELPLQSMMQELNKTRVQFKHYGVIPQTGEAQRYSGYTEEFLRQTMKEFFNQNFDDVSLADLIANQAIHEKIKEAERLLSEGQITEAINATAVAEYLSSMPFEKLLPEFDRRIDHMVNRLPHEVQEPVFRAVEYTREYISALRRTVVLGLTGRNLGQYQRYRLLAPVISRSEAGNFRTEYPFYRGWRGNKATEEDAKFCIRYVTEFAIEMEERLT